MKIRTLLLPAIFLVTLMLPRNLDGQDIFQQATQEEAPQVSSDSVAIQPFSLIGITKEYGATNRLIQEAGKKHLTEEVRGGFTREVDSLVLESNVFLNDSTTRTLEGISSRELDHIIQRAQFLKDQIDEVQADLSSVAEEIESQLVLLHNNRQRWQLTMEQAADQQALESRVERVGGTIQQIDSVSMLLQSDLVFLLEEQDKLVDKKVELEEVVSSVKNQKILLGETIFHRDVPGFFKDISNLGNVSLIRSHLQEFIGSARTDYALLKSAYLKSMIITLLLLLGFLIFTIWFKKNHARWISEDQFELSELHLTFINSPVVSTLFLVSLMVRLLIPDLPTFFYAINVLVLMVPMAILMVRVHGGVFRTWVIVLVVSISINLVYELSYHPGILLRILLMGLCSIEIWLFYWIYRKKPFSELIKHSWVYRLFRVMVVVFLVLQILSIIANLAGTFRLAESLALVPLQITSLAIAIQLTTKLTDSILYLILASNYLQKLNVIREEFQLIYRKCIWLMNFILLLIFFSIALRILGIQGLVFDWGRGVLSDGIKIGAINISLGSVLIFVFVIWLSIMLSKILSHILEKDVFTRVTTAKGIPSTVTLMLKIVLITAGFFLAAAASGMHLTNLSIVLGAFSVGIGFGLQNIFNNIVSGLILAIERPINVGDVVQVGELLGIVRSIGLRSSTVRTYDGAEVVVPNGNLISNEMINWTLSDTNRRMDIRVGVAYGTDPELVLGIMVKIAQEYPDVRKKPEPKAYFIEFGDSSLNFRLLAWVNEGNRLATESELNVLINKKLAEAGITIPFPQRDLHIRSDETKAKQDDTEAIPDDTKPKK